MMTSKHLRDNEVKGLMQYLYVDEGDIDSVMAGLWFRQLNGDAFISLMYVLSRMDFSEDFAAWEDTDRLEELLLDVCWTLINKGAFSDKGRKAFAYIQHYADFEGEVEEYEKKLKIASNYFDSVD